MNTALFSGSDLDVVFSLVLTMSLSASWIAAAVLVLRLLLKKAPRWITCLLWAMVAVRLVCPISLQSPVSAYQVAAPAAVQESGQVEYFHYVYESGDKPSIQLDVDAIRPAEAIPAQPQTTPEQSAAAEPVQETAGRSDPTRYLPPLVTVWLAVGGALLLYGLGSTLRLRLRVREAMRLPPDAGCRLLETLVLEKGLPAQDNFTGTMISIQSINGRE